MNQKNINTQLKSPLVSAKWLNDNINRDIIILDATINKNAEQSSEYLPKARFFDIKQKFSDTSAAFPSTFPSLDQFQEEARVLGINQDSVLVVYDDKGIYSSARAWWLFKTFGFDNIAVLDGGLLEWKGLHFKTVSTLDEENLKTGNFKATYRSENMCFFEDIITLSKTDDCLLLDARSEERFKSLAPEPRAGLRRGTIPKSKNLPYTKLFDGNCLKTKEELKSIFNTYPLGNKSMVFSCGSGITACILALAAEICDYKAIAVYDGSWTEYGTLTS